MDCTNNAWRYWTIACSAAASPQQMLLLLIAFLQYCTLKSASLLIRGRGSELGHLQLSNTKTKTTFVYGIIISFLRAFSELQSVFPADGIWKLYLRGATCCQTQLQCVGYSSWLPATAWALTSPPTSDRAAVYTNPSAAFHSASHAALWIVCQVGYVAERANYRTAFQ